MVRNLAILVVLASAAAPIFAAPALAQESLELDAREPRFRLSPQSLTRMKKFGHLFHKGAHGFKGTAETAATINSMIPQKQKRELDEIELEEREPKRFTPARMRKVGHVGHKIAHGLKGVVGTAASIYSMVPQRREFDDEFDLGAREPRFKPAQIRKAAHVGHKIAHGVEGGAETGVTINSMIPQHHKREFDDEFDLEAREPRFKPAQIRKAAHVGHKFAHGFKGAAETGATINSMIPQKGKREFDEDLESREFDEDMNYAREVEDLLEEILARDWEEYDELE